MGAKIDAERDVVDVAENRLAPIARDEPIEDAAGDDPGIFPPVGDRDARHQRRSAPSRRDNANMRIVP